MGLGGLLLLLLPDLLTPRGPSTPAPPLLCSPVGPGSPASLILRGTSWMSRIGLPAKAQPEVQHACWGGGRRKNQGGDPEAPQCGWGPSFFYLSSIFSFLRYTNLFYNDLLRP